jgi:hypothetical protein
MAFADRSWSFDQDVQEISRFSCMLFLSVRGFFDYAGPINPLAIGVVVVLPSSLPERSRHPDPSVFRSSIARPTDTSVYASSGTSRCRLQDSRPGWSRCLLSCRVGIELGRADVRPRVSSPALSVAEWVPSSAMATFPQAPLRSRMVGFPESGSDLGNAHKPSRWPQGLSARSTCTLHRQRFVSWAGSHYEDRSTPGSVSENHPGTAKCPEPLCLKTVFRLSERCRASPQRELPLLHRSYGLMRQTFCLHRPLV